MSLKLGEIMTADKYVIHLAKCALKNEYPKEKPENLAWGEVFRLADRHMISNMIWYSVDKLKFKPGAELWTKWTEVKNKAVVKDITQRNELKRIISAFENEKVRCMPVKGVFLKRMYPKSDFRTMSDIDILVDIENLQKAGDILRFLGYSCNNAGKAHHDVYFKAPVMNIEIHRQLFPDVSENDLNQYYKDVFINSEKIDGCEFAYKMTDEELYIYTLAHFYKHYSGGGSGIRSVIDVYVLNNTLYDKLDKQSLNCKLKKLKLLNFRNEMTELSEMWFENRKETPELTGISEYIIGSGTYGTMLNYVNKQVEKKGRAGYFIYCAFPPLPYMKSIYPALNIAPFLLPLFWIWRLISSLIAKRNMVMLKLRAILRKEKN